MTVDSLIKATSLILCSFVRFFWMTYYVLGLRHKHKSLGNLGLPCVDFRCKSLGRMSFDASLICVPRITP